MKWRRKFLWAAAAAATALVIAARAELSRWAENVEGASRLESVFFRAVPLPGGAVPMRRPPKETRPELTRLIAAAPAQADLYSLRALEAEQELDFQAAGTDWKKYAALVSDKPAGDLALADFYHRRLRPRDELAALALAAHAPPPAAERLLPALEQRPWKTFERILELIDAQALPVEAGIEQYWAWATHYPKEQQVYSRWFAYALTRKRMRAAEEAVAAYRKAFPDDAVFPVSARAQIERSGGAPAGALAVYDRSFRPLWPPELVKDYFALLGETKSLGKYLAEARRAEAANPGDLNAAARIFYYYQQQANVPAARRALVEFRQRKERSGVAWTADELFTLAQLFEGIHDYDEAAREYYALYSLSGNDAAAAERGLGGLARLLFDAPEQPIHFGSGDLSFYRDIATLDPGPGFLNGILSLVLNSTDPASQYAEEDRAAGAYFHRARAAELVALYDRRFPESAARAELHGKLIAAYATYGARDGVIAAGRQFLAVFPKAANRTDVAMRMADAYAQGNRTREEFAVYESLLKELAARAGGVPLGEGVAEAVPAAQDGQMRAAIPARSAEYARVLDRYISRLVALKRIPDALVVYRRELDRNSDDPGLYERLAAFLEQNRLGAEVEQVYRKAIEHFPDRSWSHKLARWYLRHKQTAQFQALTAGVVKTFSGTDLEAYFDDVAPRDGMAAALYRQINLYAHQRFPHNLTFVRNLLTAYRTRGTADPAAYEKLLRDNWFYADDLRARFFEMLSRSHRLDGELAAVRAANTSEAAARFLAEGEAWRCHFENAAPLLESLEAEDPGDVALGTRAAALARSLTAFDSKNLGVAVGIEERLARFRPRDSGPLTRIGEMYADRERFDAARPYWNRIAAIEPGKTGGYLEAATVFWDYYRYDDALRLIGGAREKFADASLFSYEAGAIYENQRDYGRALAEYVKGATADGVTSARTRLIELGRRPALRASVDRLTSALVAGPDPTPGAVSLRVAIFESQNRRADLEASLTALAGRVTSFDLLSQIENTARADGLETVQVRAMEREIAVLTDPVEILRRRLALARLYESQGQAAAAARTIDELYRGNPKILGVVRASVDYYWRNKNTQRAVDLLTQAAAAAEPEYRKQFNFEAARKATEAGDFIRARGLLDALLGEDPYRADYLAAMADTYARAGDDRGLGDFYRAKLAAIGMAPLSVEERIERTAALRRGLIGVLTRLKNYNGAIDQYIEILNRYPDDEGLAREAASYAAAHNASQKLVAYYEKAVAGSPRDSRLAVVLGRIDAQLENLPAAITAYDRATAIRPDRSDLFIARAGLEERLLRFDAAVRDYLKIYDLTYGNSEWMEKIAETRARQGQTDAAVAALRKARIEGRPDRAGNYFAAARDLESWGMLPQARQFAELGMDRAGADAAEVEQGAATYVEILTRQRAYAIAWARLANALAPLRRLRGMGPAVVGANGLRFGLSAALPSLPGMGAVVARNYTPEEKAAFAAFLESAQGAAASFKATGNTLPPRSVVREFPEKQRAGASRETVEQILLPLAASAGLYELEARWRREFLMANAGQPAAQAEMVRLIELERQRMKFSELGGWLEAYWMVVPADTQNRDEILVTAAASYRSAGDAAAEMRVLALKNRQSGLGGQNLARYLALLARNQTRGLVTLAGAGGNDSTRNRA
ncbi:MAG: hypothetical protein ABI165_15250, partial [Bryobacteraceae bacterium]